MQKVKGSSSSDFDSKMFECVETALAAIGHDQKELLRLRLKNRYYLPLKNAARAPLTFELALTDTVGPSVAEKIVQNILVNISKSFGIHSSSDTNLAQAFEAARKTSSWSFKMGVRKPSSNKTVAAAAAQTEMKGSSSFPKSNFGGRRRSVKIRL